jgi:DnaJ-class molecular chaperone
MKTCPDCNGDGVVDKDTDDERQCSTCGGLGFVPDNDDEHEEVIKTSRDLLLKQTVPGGSATRR